MSLSYFQSISVVFGESKPGEDPIDTVKEEIFSVAPSCIVFVGDRSEWGGNASRVFESSLFGQKG